MAGKRKTVYLISMGPGSFSELTIQAANAVKDSQCLIGAERLLDSLGELAEEKEQIKRIKAPEIADYIEKTEHEKIGVILSGDIGFFSGAKKLIPLLDQMNCNTISVPGVSSLVYLCSKVKVPWQDVKLVSLHGRKASVLGPVLTNPRVFFLTGNNMSVQDICVQLKEKEMDQLMVWAGENLSYPSERIFQGTVAEISKMEFDSLSVLLVENPNPLASSMGNFGIPDSAFERGDVPMTKEEVRAVSLSKLRVMKDSVVYDIGAGTGSVTVEAGFRAIDGTVYAVEKNPEALKLLKTNKENFGLKNIEIIPGIAPAAMEGLPPADRVFIGGSSGNLREILGLVLDKNPACRIVVNAITIETLGEAVRLFEELEFTDIDIASLSCAKGRKVGGSHMMTALNPVYVISGQGKGEKG